MSHGAAALGLEVEGTKTILPDAEGVFDALARISYEFEHAIADLVDNSVDAGATEVLIRFFHDRKSVYSVAVIDTGEAWLRTASIRPWPSARAPEGRTSTSASTEWG